MTLNDQLFLFSKILRRLPGAKKVSKNFNDRRHHKIYQKMKPYFEYSLNQVKDSKGKKASQIIWCFWWQGEQNMTPIVRRCYDSIKKNSGSFQVILITKDNIKHYSNIPNYIFEKVNNGVITYTHLSDILRFNLLNKFGGLWLDATIFCNKTIKINLDKIFTCSGYTDITDFNIAKGRWTGFCIGGPSGAKLFSFMDHFFNIYWKYNNSLIDYFLIDYALNFAWSNNISDFRKICFLNRNNNPNMFKLQPLLNKKYDNNIWKQISTNTNLFKLSNRKIIKENKKNSFYDLLVK